MSETPVASAANQANNSVQHSNVPLNYNNPNNSSTQQHGCRLIPQHRISYWRGGGGAGSSCRLSVTQPGTSLSDSHSAWPPLCLSLGLKSGCRGLVFCRGSVGREQFSGIQRGTAVWRSATTCKRQACNWCSALSSTHTAQAMPKPSRTTQTHDSRSFGCPRSCCSSQTPAPTAAPLGWCWSAPVAG